MLLSATLLAAAPELACDHALASPVCALLHDAEVGPAPFGPRVGLAFECEAELRVAQAGILDEAHAAVLRGRELAVVDAADLVRDELVACLEGGCAEVDARGMVSRARGAGSRSVELYRARRGDHGFIVAVSLAAPGVCGWVAVFPDVPAG